MNNKAQETLGALIVALVILGVIIGIFYFANSSSITGNTIKIQNPIKNCRNEQVPYEETETYNYYLKGRIASRHTDSNFNFQQGVFAISRVSLQNIDNEGGWFTVTFNWETLNGKKTTSERHFVEPDEIILFESYYDTNLGEDWRVSHDFKSDPVQKTRTVTKYRTEEVCN